MRDGRTIIMQGGYNVSIGKLIVFEGLDGSGKTTQARLLYADLATRGFDVVSTRQPGGTSIGERIRAMLGSTDNGTMSPITEAFLCCAAHAQAVDDVILPALARGAIAIADRFTASTLAYQGYGRGLDLHMVRLLIEYATYDTLGSFTDLTVYLDIPPAVGLARKHADGRVDRMDAQGLAFYDAVREGYLEMARTDADRWLVLDGTQPVEELSAAITVRVLTLLQAPESPWMRLAH